MVSAELVDFLGQVLSDLYVFDELTHRSRSVDFANGRRGLSDMS